MFNIIKRILTPFEQVDGRWITILTIWQVGIALAIWIIAPLGMISSPQEIIAAWVKLVNEQALLRELFVSSWTIIQALFFSTLITWTLALLSTSPVAKRPIMWATAARFLGFAGITFLFTLWTSGGAQLKVALLTFGMTVFQLTSAVATVRSVTQAEIDYAKTLRLKGWGITWEVVFRGRLDDLFDQIRQNAAVGWTLLSMVEGLVRSEGGIGSLLLNSSKHLHLAQISALQLTILFYGILQDGFLQYLKGIICPYVKLERR